MWPAFWLLGNEKWPDTGEIDIMEYVGEPDWTVVALHGPGCSGETPIVTKFTFDQGTEATDWHVFAIAWTKNALLFETDGPLAYRATRAMVECYGEWRFDTDKFLILNFALGGAYPYKTSKIEKPYTGIPQQTVDAIKAGEVAMYVDWVRVYAPPSPKADQSRSSRYPIIGSRPSTRAGEPRPVAPIASHVAAVMVPTRTRNISATSTICASPASFPVIPRLSPTVAKAEIHSNSTSVREWGVRTAR